ncbi:histidyl tRNA synthetase 2, isoform CRA_a [Mus musculus]|nr:histidyl tRNA synthetase 2, isoform CRA_a [Mus musculus]EDL28474.1 histidyl tRNA synthetase 2, isoform CRA_a [Mus musculus]
MEDSQKELEHMVRKILNLRVFEDESGKHWSKSVMDKEYEVLCVSQFTLQCVLKGNKPDFHLAMPTEQAESFYNSFPGAASQELQTRAYQRWQVWCLHAGAHSERWACDYRAGVPCSWSC